jgi:ABC-type dipeptide/oligopeptide/nickel transport systems, permease components
MTLYIARRLLWTIVVVFSVILITFAIFYLLPAGDPALRFAGKNPNPAQLALIRHRLGLDQPFWKQFLLFTYHFFRGDQFGWPGSATRMPAGPR